MGLTSNVFLMTCLPMRCAVELTEPEKKAFQQLSLKHPHEDFRPRGQGLLELSRSRRIHEIALELDVSEVGVQLGARFEGRRSCGLLTGHKASITHKS